jgi:hypothetical protein
MKARCGVLAVLVALAAAAPAHARAPVIGYVDGASGALAIYDAETGRAVAAPALDVGGVVKRFAFSHDGRYVVYVDSDRDLRLFDRATALDLDLPGADVSDGPDGLTVSNTGLVGFDDGGNGPARVYDSVARRFVPTGLAAANGHRQPRLSGDGRFLATTCVDTCSSPPVSGSDAYLRDLTTRAAVPFPKDLSGSTQSDEEHPCIDGDGSLIALNATHPAQSDVFLYDRVLASPFDIAGINDPAQNDFDCVMDSSGRYVGLTAFDAFKLYDRTAAAFLTLPSAVANATGRPSDASLTDPFTPGELGPRRPVIAYVDPETGRFNLYDAQLGRRIPAPTVPDGLTRFAVSGNGRFVAYSNPTTHRLNLLDRAAGAKRSLPGIDVFANPGSLSVSDTGRLAFDDNVNGPVRVYDSAARAFVATGLPADGDHRMPRLSADGRFLATTCLDLSPDGCITPSGGDSDLYLQHLTTQQPAVVPDTLGGAAGRDEERPCLNGNGSLLGFDAGQPIQHDVLLFSRTAGRLVNTGGLNDPAQEDLNCALDPTGTWIARTNAAGELRVQSRPGHGALVLPPEIADRVWLVMPAAGSASVVAGELRFAAGTGTGNAVTITRSGASYVVEDERAPIAPRAGCTALTHSKVSCPAAGVAAIAITLGDQADSATVSRAITVPANIVGGPGDDALTGGRGADRLTGGAGNDRLTAADDVVDTAVACGDGTADAATIDADEEPVTTGCETVTSPL